MRYTIDQRIIDQNGQVSTITVELDTENQTASLTAYHTDLQFTDFIEFADAIQEIRRKFTVINAKEEKNGTTEA